MRDCLPQTDLWEYLWGIFLITLIITAKPTLNVDIPFWCQSRKMDIQDTKQASMFCLVFVHFCWQGHKLRYCHSDSLTDIRATSSRLQIWSKDQKLALQESFSPLAPYLDGLGMECHRLNNCWALSFLAMRQPWLDYSDNMI